MEIYDIKIPISKGNNITSRASKVGGGLI